MDLEINHKIKISDLLEKLTTTQQIEVVKYLLDYDKVKEVIETEIIKNSIEVDDLNDEIESLESEIKTLQNKEDKYKFSILIFPNELTTIQKFKENNYLDFKYKIDYTLKNKITALGRLFPEQKPKSYGNKYNYQNREI